MNLCSLRQGLQWKPVARLFCRATSWNGKPGLQNNIALINVYERLVLFWKGAQNTNVARLRLCNWRATLRPRLRMPVRIRLLLKMRRRENIQWLRDV